MKNRWGPIATLVIWIAALTVFLITRDWILLSVMVIIGFLAGGIVALGMTDDDGKDKLT